LTNNLHARWAGRRNFIVIGSPCDIAGPIRRLIAARIPRLVA
jgi:hypothetical protein